MCPPGLRPNLAKRRKCFAASADWCGGAVCSIAPRNCQLVVCTSLRNEGCAACHFWLRALDNVGQVWLHVMADARCGGWDFVPDRACQAIWLAKLVGCGCSVRLPSGRWA